ncbi:portal protein [Arthrobacter phage Vibaki]|uniref:Portal protein n=1 Tax=Arthrobacter phage Vibaki TaxID=2593333 RepID=A0A514TYW6_9CAUD|nr:portal protein [Arthrobacter phage Vibaki]QDK01886.1 portal protein [Arthrobacter phage Vibaki]
MVVKVDPEIGTPGGIAISADTKAASAYVVEPLDPNPDMHFPLSVAVYDEMRTTDGQVGSLLSAINLPILAARWQLTGDTVRPEVMTFVRSELGLDLPDAARERQRKHGIVWLDHLETALLALPFGFMPFEQVYEPGPPTAEQEALGSDLLLHLRKLAPRLPRTISEIHVGRDGGLVGISQPPLDPKAKDDIFIPVERLVYYCYKREGADWSGRSVLRTIYKNWLIGDKLLRLSAQIVERNGMGIPTITYDKEISKAEAEQLVQDLRAGATAGAALPAGTKLELTGVTGQTVDPLPHMKYHDEKIAESALAMFKTLGHDSGARSLGDTFVDIFTQAVQSVADFFARTATEHIIRDLVELNFGVEEPYPVLTAGDLSANKAITTTALKELVDAGVVKPDPKLEAFIRSTSGLPVAEPADDAAGSAANALELANAVGALIRSGYDPAEAAKAVGLPEIKHLGLLPVTVQPPAAGTDLENAPEPVPGTPSAPKPAAAAPAAAALAEGDHPKLARLEQIMLELAEYRAGQHVQ